MAGDEAGGSEGRPAPSPPDGPTPTPDLAAIEAVMRRAIDDRRPDLVSIIGKGELSIAVRWEQDGTPCVVKRVPPFPTPATAASYIDLVRTHIADLEAHDVRCVTTALHTLDRPDGSVIVYHCQPLLDVDRLADHVLRRNEPRPDDPLLVSVLDAAVRTIGAGVPLDAQYANWLWHDGRPWQLDFSTPLMLDERGHVRFDTTGFVREYPVPVRRLVYRELMKVAAHYTEVDWVLTDVLVQLFREDLVPWCEPLVTAARERHGISLSTAEAQKRFEADRRFYPTLLKLKRAQRAWMQRTHRRYDTLLPATTSFGR